MGSNGPNIPRLSVVLPVYNAGRYLAEAVESILQQSFQDFELIAVNDGSTDGSPRILEALASRDPRIRILNQENRGQVASMNRAVGEARADLVARMDADDIALSHRFEDQVGHLDAHPEVVLVGGRTIVIDERGVPLDVWEPPVSASALRATLPRQNCFCHPSVIFRKSAFEECGGYREAYAPSEDYDLWLRLLEIGEVANVPRVVLAYRFHRENLSATRTRKQALASLAANLSFRRRAEGKPDISIHERLTVGEIEDSMGETRGEVRAYLARTFDWNVRQAFRFLTPADALRTFGEYVGVMGDRKSDEQIVEVLRDWPTRHSPLPQRLSFYSALAAYLRRSDAPLDQKASNLRQLLRPERQTERSLDVDFTETKGPDEAKREGFIERLGIWTHGEYSVIKVCGWAPWKFRRGRTQLRVHGLSEARLLSSSILARPDVVKAHGKKKMLWSGFEIVLIARTESRLQVAQIEISTRSRKGKQKFLNRYAGTVFLNEPETYRPVVPLKPVIIEPDFIPAVGEDEILCFMYVRNEALRLPAVLNYHRDLGVDRFFILDNESDDGTGEYLAQQQDVVLFRSPDEFGATRCGNTWMHELLDRFGRNHWCLLVDADEYFVYPQSEKVNLRGYTRYLDKHGYGVVSGLCVDMYGNESCDNVEYLAGSDLLEACPYFDAGDNYEFEACTGELPSWSAYGGCRKRVFWSTEQLHAFSDATFDERFYLANNPDVAEAVAAGGFKSGWDHYQLHGKMEGRAIKGLRPPLLTIIPLVKWHAGLRFETARHKLRGPRLPREAPERAAVLHFKFISAFRKQVDLEVERGEHWQNAIEYRIYQNAFQSSKTINFFFPGSIRYGSSRTLLDEGLIRTSRTFEDFASGTASTGAETSAAVPTR